MNEEDKRNCHSYVAFIMIITFNMFLNKENTIGCYFSICAISFVAFVCILHRHRVIFACCAGMFVLACENSRPSSLPARVAFREKDVCDLPPKITY